VLGTGIYVTGVAGTSLSNVGVYGQQGEDNPDSPLPTNQSAGVGPPVVSDIRLKRDIAQVGELDSGINLYRYRYLWSDTTYVGVMAHEVAAVKPDAVQRGADGYLRVDYARLGLRLQTWDQWAATH
jgi:hypothetical protein